MKRQRRTFSAEFKLEAGQLVIDQGYSITETSRSLGVGETVGSSKCKGSKGAKPPRARR